MSQNRSRSISPEPGDNAEATSPGHTTHMGEERHAHFEAPTETIITYHAAEEVISPVLSMSPFGEDTVQSRSWSRDLDTQIPVLEANGADDVQLFQEASEREIVRERDRGRQHVNFQASDLSDHDLVIGPRVGAGSFGSVYQGHHALHGEVAVKIVHGYDSKTLSSGLKEMCASMVMGQNPHIATVFETRVCQHHSSSNALEDEASHGTLRSMQESPLQTQRRQSWTASTDSLLRYVTDARGNENGMSVMVFSRGPESGRELEEFLSSLDVKTASEIGDLYFVIIGEFCNGGTLYEALSRGDLHNTNTQAKYAFLRAIALGAAYGVQHLHHCNMIHRDLSNTNIMLHYTRLLEDGKLDPDSLTAKLIDFGRASGNAAKIMKTDNLGTASYCAPEFMIYGDSSKSSDIFSLGVLMWEVWTGRLAWEGARDVQVVYAISSGKTLDISEDFPQDLAHLVKSCMSFDPSHRPVIDDVVGELERLTRLEDKDGCEEE